MHIGIHLCGQFGQETNMSGRGWWCVSVFTTTMWDETVRHLRRFVKKCFPAHVTPSQHADTRSLICFFSSVGRVTAKCARGPSQWARVRNRRPTQHRRFFSLVWRCAVEVVRDQMKCGRWWPRCSRHKQSYARVPTSRPWCVVAFRKTWTTPRVRRTTTPNRVLSVLGFGRQTTCFNPECTVVDWRK